VRYYYLTTFRKKPGKTVKSDKQLVLKIKQILVAFFENQNYPSLRLHKLTGKSTSAWSISVNKSIRIVFYYVEDGVVLVDLVKHEEVY